MTYSFSQMIDISDKSSIGISDNMTMVAVRVTCLADECDSRKMDMCKLKDLIQQTNEILGEYETKVDIENNISLIILHSGAESYFKFQKALDILIDKWESLDVFVNCQCTLRKELNLVRESFISLFNSTLPADLKF